MDRHESDQHMSHYCCCWCPGPWFNVKMTSYQYRKFHCGDKTILRPSYLHNGISYTGKMTSLYWIGAQESNEWNGQLWASFELSEVNSLVPGNCGSNFESLIFKLIIQNCSLGSHCEIAVKWMPQNITKKKSTLVKVMAWCLQATSHYQSQSWLSCLRFNYSTLGMQGLICP